LERADPTRTGQSLESRRVGQQPSRQADRIDQDERLQFHPFRRLMESKPRAGWNRRSQALQGERAAMSTDPTREIPPYTYVPGGPWPHPTRSPLGHSYRRADPGIEPKSSTRGPAFLHGVALFDAGYYWEAHEAWEGLWHAQGRRGATAEVLKGLIKLAAAGVKVRERRHEGVRTHARRAADAFAKARTEGGAHQLGLNLDHWIERARAIAADPPSDPGPRDAPVTRVFAFQIGEPGRRAIRIEGS